MSVGIKDIAKAASVSNFTVSDILNRGRKHLYRPETVERVIRLATELDYHPNRSARSMRSQRNKVVGFLTQNMSPDGRLANHLVYPFVVGMSHYFTDLGYHVSLVEMKELDSLQVGEVPELLREVFFDGLVIHCGAPEQVRSMLSQRKIPIVWWDSGIFDEFDCINRDDASVARNLTRRLIEIGHRRIAMLVGERGWQSYREGKPVHYSYSHRYEAFVAEMEAHGLEAMRIVGYGVNEIVEQLSRQDITAVITQGQTMHPLLVPCALLGWSIPQDLSVGACDIEPRIDPIQLEPGGVSYDRYEAGQRAAAMLLKKIEIPGYDAPSEQISGIVSPGDTIAPLRIDSKNNAPT